MMPTVYLWFGILDVLAKGLAMNESKVDNKSLQKKRTWRSPEIITVGGVLDLTEGTSENVRDNHHGKPPTWFSN